MCYVQTVVEQSFACSKEVAFAQATNLEEFPEFFKGYGPIPKVVKCELLSPLPVRVGSERLITNADGSKLLEKVEVFEPGLEHRYRIETGFVPPFSWLVKAAVGHWSYEDDGRGSKVRWRYRFELKSHWMIPLVGIVVHVFFKRAMSHCLKEMQRSC